MYRTNGTAKSGGGGGGVAKPGSPIRRLSMCQRMSSFIVGGFEAFFYRYGYAVGSNPWRFVLGSLLLVAVSSLGMLRFRQEKHPMKLWVPQGSTFAADTEWLMARFGQGYRVQTVLVTAPDVLQPHVLAKMQSIHTAVVGAVSDEGDTWADVCFRVPVVSFNLRRRRSSSGDGGGGDDGGGDGGGGGGGAEEEQEQEEEEEEEEYGELEMDPSIYFSPHVYCSLVESLDTACYTHSLLDLWEYGVDAAGPPKPDILLRLNSTTVSPTLGHPMDYVHLLGDVRRDPDTGQVLSAGAVMSLYMVAVNFSAVNMEETGNDAGTSDWANGPALLWEKKFAEVMEEMSAHVEGMEIYYEAGRSFADLSATTMFQDMDKLVLGVIMMYIYVQIILSKCNMVEMRFYLGSIGLGCIGLAFVVACGICSLLGIPYGPVHTALPFLLLGIGVDDMFVIMACWHNLGHADKQGPLPEKMGRTLQHAGTSITITSLTNAVAFAVGATTILPSLQSFCLYAAMGILVTFIFQASLFSACFVIDERRVMQNRNGILFCYKHTEFKPNSCSQKSISSSAFNFVYSKLIFTKMGTIFVLLMMVGITSISIKGNLELKQKFDPAWFLPTGSHLQRFQAERTRNYPDSGMDASIYMGNLNYSAEIANIQRLVETVRNQTDILQPGITEWYTGFREYVNKHFKQNIPDEPMSESDFNTYISRYLFSPGGAKYQSNFRFQGDLKCGHPAPPVVVSSIGFSFRLFQGPEEYLPAMNHINAVARSANFTTGDKFVTVWGKIFANWVTDEVIDTELYRNLLLACLCVMVCTVVLIVNIVTCFFIFICVVLTLVNVAGMMYFWGLTIDVVSCIGLQLAAGLCVDYAAHIGHKFLMCTGTRRARALQTVTDIGPAVASGGMSTLLALSVLAGSQSYVFVSFFKIFGLVVLFGLFHGVVVLPVLLSLLGPEPYQLQAEPDELSSAAAALASGEPNGKAYELCSTDKMVTSEEKDDEMSSPASQPFLADGDQSPN